MYHINDDPRSIYSKNMLYRALAEKLQEQAFPTITIKEVVQRHKWADRHFIAILIN